MEEDLVPPAHRPLAEVGERHVLTLQVLLHGLDVVGPERDVATIDRVDEMAGAKRKISIPHRQMKLDHSVGDELNVCRADDRGNALAFHLGSGSQPEYRSV